MFRNALPALTFLLLVILVGSIGTSSVGASTAPLGPAIAQTDADDETTFTVELANATQAEDGYTAFDLRIAATSDVDLSGMDAFGGNGDPVITASIGGEEVARSNGTVPLDGTFVTLTVPNSTLAPHAGTDTTLNISLWDQDVASDDYIASTERTISISSDIEVLVTPPTDADEDQATPAESNANEDGEQAVQGGQLLAEASFDEHGLLTSISPDGNYAAFAMHTGEIAVYNTNADTFTRVQGPVTGQPSQILLQDTGRATVAWMDNYAFGTVDLTQRTDMTWQAESDGLWNIDASENHSSIATVTYPDVGPGRVGVATGDGDLVWDHSLDEAAAESVAITDAGYSVAVGGIEYWTETGTSGTPGVRMYDGQTGDQQWVHETASNVWAVDIHEEQELVAATTDNALIVLDFEGNVVWQTDEGGSWLAISDDGSTVVTTEDGAPVAYNATTGEEQWRADDAPGIVSDRLAISADGDRVVASEAAGWTYLVESGEVVWQENQGNPANVDISTDGETWSVIVQNNERGGIEASIYRTNSPEE